jgi:nitroimidazol reductase NimA-like FMN-containing flavoprotein (pyridoxamine 5'-phosphate oxidase superfamily)
VQECHDDRDGVDPEFVLGEPFSQGTIVIIRDVGVDDVADLAFAPPRAALAATVSNEIHLLPIRLTVSDPADLAASPRMVQVPDGTPNLDGRSVVAVADDGPQWFRLRSLMVRGTAIATGNQSYRVTPQRVVAWDYGRLRYKPTPPQTAQPRQPSFSGADYQDMHPFRSPNLAAALSTSHVMILATRSPNGTPFAVPLWFVSHQGRIYATTAASSWTIRNVAAHSQVALLLGGEGARSTDRLLVHGQAQAVRGPAPVAVLARMAWRYYLQPRFAAVELGHLPLWGRRVQYYAQSQPAYVVITPQSAIECRAP